MAIQKTKSSNDKNAKRISRRDFIKTATAGMAAVGLGANIINPRRVAADRKKLKILKWSHIVPSFDEWFKETLAQEWGEKNDTEVTVDYFFAPVELLQKASAEVSAQKGHDLVMSLWPPAAFEHHVIDHGEIYQECEKKCGKANALAVKSTYNPKTKKYFGFSESYVPDPINYRKDLWDGVGIYPNTWEDVLRGGSKIKKKDGNPVLIGISSELDSNMAMRAIMYSYGASVQDEAGNVVINSKQTLKAVNFVRSLFKEAMTPEVLTWADPGSNNELMLDGTGSLAMNAISITRTAENRKMTEMSKKIWLAKAPAGPVRRTGLEHICSIYLIWKFADNIKGAKQFLVDYIGNSREAFLGSELYNFPSFPDTVPDLDKLIANDSKADPSDKYKILEDAETWTTNVGDPGYTNAAIDEIFGRNVIPTMFKKVATDEAAADEAVREAEATCKQIFGRWRERGLV
jgi:multiple sugar transport system substrate-binding protein